MSKGSMGEKNLTLPQVKKLLESIGEENLDQLQRRTLDYVSKFSKVDIKVAERLSQRLVTEFGFDEEEAVQIVNCLPMTVDELRIFLAGGKKIIDASTLKTIVSILGELQRAE